MKKLSYLIGLLFIGCYSNKITTHKNCIEKPIKNCICTEQYDPVCGCNGKTYGNACSANCAGVKKYTKGECKRIKNSQF